MQSPNRPISKPGLNRQQNILIAIISIFIALIFLSFFLLHKSTSKHVPGEYYDNFSHQTISNPPGKGPDTFGTTSNNPIYLGIDKLLDHGLSFDQLNNLKIAFSHYSQSKTPPIKEISIDVDHITTQYNKLDPNAHYFVFFNVRFDRKSTYKARIEYSGLEDIRLYLIQPADNKVIYDSQVIGTELN